jgi:hypothetical protein
MNNPIKLVKNPDKTWTLFYFAQEVGYISKRPSMSGNHNTYRGVSVHGSIVWAGSLDSAQSALLSEYH